MNKALSMNKEDFRSWNEQMAKTYDPEAYHASTGIVGWVERSRVRKIIKLLASDSEKNVLEVGVGAGNILEQVAAKAKTGIDLSTYLLEKAKKRLPSAELIEGDAENLLAHFKPRSFDRVYCSEVLEHVQHPEKVLQGIADVLTDDGIAIVSVPNEKMINGLKAFLKSIGLFRILFPSIADHMEDEWHLRMFDKTMVMHLCSRWFTIEKIAAVPFQFLPIRYVVRVKRMPAERNIESLIQCPACRGAVRQIEAGYVCTECGHEYRDHMGIPALLPESTTFDGASTEGSSFKDFFKRWPPLYNFLFAVIGPSLFTGLTSTKFAKKYSDAKRVLYAGSGPRRISESAVNCDITPFPGVDVVADLTALPFKDHSFDAVTCEQVLEHVPNPYKAAQELGRIVKSGGLIHIAVPFVFPWHPSPSDFSRWTIEGLQSLFPGSTLVERGVMAGPFSALNAVLPSFFSVILSFGIPPLRMALEYAFLILLCPLKLLDIVFAYVPGAERVAGSVYVVLKKG